MSVSVIPLFRVVANGRVKGGPLRLTLIATPLLPDRNGLFDIAKWPEQMADRLSGGKAPFANGQLTLWVRQIGNKAPPAAGTTGWESVKIEPVNREAYKTGWAEIQALWSATLGGSGAKWADLAADIKASMRRQKVKGKVDKDGKSIGEPELADAYSGKTKLEQDGSILVKPPGKDDALQVSSVIPIRQSDLAIEEETIRAARILAKQYAGPFAILDDRGPEEPVVEDPQTRFNAAIKATQPERAYAAETYRAIAEAITSSKYNPPAPKDLPSRPELVPPVEHVVARCVEPKEEAKTPADRNRDKRRATQEYGVWLQRRPGYIGTRDKDEKLVPPEVPDEGKLPRAEDEALQKMRGTFSALQGDPILSRLFCLAFDFEVVGRFPFTGDVHLAVGLEDAAGPEMQVASAARLEGDSFWPVSIFELMATSQPDFVDQKAGFWKLDGKRFDAPRYEITSLDVRRSVDSKTLGRDRGEAHQTGGLTILDRGRSEQIARDLALAEFNRKKLDKQVQGEADAEMVVLHAEELTIGRRVDVGVETKSKGLIWRSLMCRYVNYDFGVIDAEIEIVLRALIEDFRENKTKGMLEETSFQVAARLVPLPPIPAPAPAPGEKQAKATPGGYEAVAEEAIFLWDGTPVSVLTDSGRRDSLASSLPFDSMLDLPGNAEDEKDHRPPPLRFGVPYAFRLRSAFLGGGSPAFNADGNVDSPAETIVGPRRFLRHNSIAAPILLLPRHLADKRFGHMGYEPVDQAIVRSWNAVPSRLGNLHRPDVVKGEYIGASQRTQPTETIRVFVPPEAPLDLVTRHGELDADSTMVAEIRQGGLRDVSYTPRTNHGSGIDYLKDDKGEIVTKPVGFPVAVSTRLDALDSEGVIYPRKVIPAELAEERGVPVFEPGGTNATGPGQVGYLPDPAIDHYCVRAKNRDSDVYLSSYRCVKLYEGTAFPNALPLVVKVKRVTSVRPAAPMSIEDICGPAKLNTIDDQGEMPAKGKKRARVQSIELTLYQGEDYTLEVSCLPTDVDLEKHFSVPETIAMQLHFAGTNSDAKARLEVICGKAVTLACVPASTEGSACLGGNPVPSEKDRRNAAKALLEAMQTKWPIEEIAAVTPLRVCHALNKPPVEAFRWSSTEKTIKTVRPAGASVTLGEPPPDSANNATELGLDGEIEIDLDLIQSFQIMATAVGADGFAIDAVDRGRSAISKRSGRWPVLIERDGCEAYVKTDDVVGFGVDRTGVVTLPKEPVTLLSVANLPSTGAVGPEVTLNKGEFASCASKLRLRPDAAALKEGLVFKGLNGRRTKIALWPLFAAAISKTELDQWIALPNGARDKTNRTRRLQVQRPHIFTDTLARELTLDLVVVSRGAPAFETEPRYRDGTEQALVRRQPLKREEQAMRASTQLKVWMKSTKAPAAPDVRRPEPSFVFTRDVAETGHATKHCVRREARTRLYLGRGWFSSGEGERLGIVLWPPDYGLLDRRGNDKDPLDLDANKVLVGDRTMLLDEFDDRDLGAGGAFVTRWGGDPTRKDACKQTGYFIPPRAFRDVPELRDPAPDGGGDGASTAKPNPHAPLFVKRAQMPIPRAALPVSDASDAAAARPQEYLPVSLITYQPCFDLDREEWYVDVDLLPMRASEPFVRFGLVRYQEQSVDEDLKTSEPVAVQMQLLPERTVTLKVAPLDTKTGGKYPGSRVTVTVNGRGSLAVKEPVIRGLPFQPTPDGKPPWDGWIETFQRLHKPKMRASVFFEGGAPNSRIRVPLALPGWSVAPSEAESALPLEIPYVGLHGDISEWERSFDLPTAIVEGFGAGQVVLYLEEVDLRMPASYREEPVTLEKMFDPNTFVTSGPRFSARVPFLAT